MIKLNLAVAISDCVDPKEHAVTLKSTDFGEVVIESASEKVAASLEDIEEAVSHLREFCSNNKRDIRPSIAMIEATPDAPIMQMEFGEAADRD